MESFSVSCQRSACACPYFSGNVLLSSRGGGPIFDIEVRHLGEVTDVTGDDGEAVHESNGSDVKVLAPYTDALPLPLPKDGISILLVEKDVPLAEVGDGLDKGNMTLR